MRLGKQGQAGQHHDWAWYAESGEVDDNTEGDDWHDAYEENKYEWGYDADSGWTAIQDGEWYYQEYEDIWAKYDTDGNMTEYLEPDQDDDYIETYFGGKSKGRGKSRK
eukprot:2035422-Pyramimonas_sp.AAC.1